MKLTNILLGSIFLIVVSFTLTGCPDNPGENSGGHGHSHSSLQPLTIIHRA